MPIYLYLYSEIKKDILSGKIKSGEKLPSKRTFAEHIGVSVITVEYAYAALADEGYVYAQKRRGYFACGIEHPFSAVPQPKPLAESTTEGEEEVDFPFSALTKIMRKVISAYGQKLLEKAPHKGCPILREAISKYLMRERGMYAPAERIIIGSGAENIYGMLVQIFGRDKIFGIEDPSYERIKDVYKLFGAEVDMLPLDSHGIASAALEKTNADILHVTPFNSFPAGITANAAKRMEYLAWAKRTGGIIAEDDFASEFAVGVKPVETIFSMDTEDSVVYINTFSKSLAPSMRLGYMILPEKFLPLYEEKLGFLSCSVPVFDQYFIAEFIESGGFERHLARKRRKLKEKQKLR
ncbi:MAG: PLP-dependent aminotransferase family protein [Clostridia bacterium]|nr:PLP-dependent aminotransferase family protein [Clostridia bacterium]